MKSKDERISTLLSELETSSSNYKDILKEKENELITSQEEISRLEVDQVELRKSIKSKEKELQEVENIASNLKDEIATLNQNKISIEDRFNDIMDTADGHEKIIHEKEQKLLALEANLLENSNNLRDKQDKNELLNKEIQEQLVQFEKQKDELQLKMIDLEAEHKIALSNHVAITAASFISTTEICSS